MKLKTISELLVILKSEEYQGKSIVFTNGCFDIIHAGHIKSLENAKLQGDVLIVGLNSDSSIKQIKGEKRPINNQADRITVLSALSCVDYIVIFEDLTPEKLIKIIKPDVYCKGGDYNKSQLHSTAFIEGYGGQVIITPLLAGRSTSNILKVQECPNYQHHFTIKYNDCQYKHCFHCNSCQTYDACTHKRD